MKPDFSAAVAGPGGAAGAAAEQSPAAGLLRFAGDAAVAIPILAVVAFAAVFSTAMPLTDEWLLLRSVIALEHVDVFSSGGLAQVLQLIPYRIYDHHVIIPFLLYWPVSELSGFDNRALLAITVAVWMGILFIFRHAVIRSGWWTVPAAVVLFSPARYMEFLWGFQFTLALSVIFPMLALVLLSRTGEQEALSRQAGRALVAIALIVIGTLCSAGGFFGFIAAVVVLSLLPLRGGSRLLLLEVTMAAAAVTYFVLMRDSGRVPVIDWRNILFILTAIGSTIVGMPDAFREFGIDARSITGAAVVLLMAAALVIAARRRILPALALAAGIFTFGFCSVAAIAVAREYLGNWHLVYAVPVVAASYAACTIVFRQSRSVASGQLCFSAAIILMLGLIGWFNAFSQYGPAYNAYIRSIEDYARNYLAQPLQPKPFPGTGGWDLDAGMVWFLASRHHPVFAADDRAILSAQRIPAPGAALSFARDSNAGKPDAPELLIASLPAGQQADALVLGSTAGDIVLRRTDPRVVQSPACPALCFTALARPSALPANPAAGLGAVGLKTSR